MKLTLLKKTGVVDDPDPRTTPPTRIFPVSPQYDDAKLTPAKSIHCIFVVLNGTADAASGLVTAQLFVKGEIAQGVLSPAGGATSETRWVPVGSPKTVSNNELVTFRLPPAADKDDCFMRLTSISGTSATDVAMYWAPGGEMEADLGLGSATGAIATLNSAIQALMLAQYNATRPVLADRIASIAQANQRGDITVMEQYLPSAEDSANGGFHTFERAIADVLGAWTGYHSGTTKVGTAGINVKAAVGRVRQLRGVNTSTTVDYYLVLVDKATAPINGDAVVDAIALPRSAAGVAVNEKHRDYPGGKKMTAGFSYAISTTPHTVTLAAALDCSVGAEYA